MKKEWSKESIKKGTNFHFDNSYFNEPQLFESIMLYQIGDLSCKGGYVVPEHKQLCYEISYIVSGTGIFMNKDDCYRVGEGDIILNVPGELHGGKADDDNPFRYFYVGFNFVNGADEQNSLSHIKKLFDQLQQSVVSNKQNIEVPFVQIFNELINLEKYSTYMIEMYLHQIVVLAYRSFCDNWLTKYRPGMKDSETKQIVYKVINYIDTNLYRIKALSDIAEELHYSYSYLSSIFAKEIGLTIKDYYNRKRFEKAIEWLKSGELNVTQVAEKLQYQSIHAFSKAFRQNFGVSPTGYQTLLMKQGDGSSVSRNKRTVPHLTTQKRNNTTVKKDKPSLWKI
ncbi:hypothetical protein CIL05_16925 [Virgibacillus profundi]|uniref:HTH araC/xylS-type domain-containing protein n=1 Tax=Virgibacillus profundi TaxID=2024555 RepID=A0A2A2I9C0_9BACI|nr:AraC family transcriptional regulator [Virgibacillus profundi]PAV28319.1 hypothetical protein CIL05_16925 [Virgibacillus profundi]PXY52319.1 AraC family transcriptional regulator [Virgibacillus profundi]